MEKQKTQPTKKNRESSIRWQGRTIEQFGYVLNLVLGLSVAGIGYEINLLLSECIDIGCWQRLLFGVSLLALVISSCSALCCVLIRLQNFRKTAEIARLRENGASDLKLQPMRTKSRSLGDTSWILLYCQVFSFAGGILFLVAAIVCSIFV